MEGASTPLLETIQKLQFTNRAEAERLLLDFIAQTFPQLFIIQVELRPQAISLNSFNGFVTLQNANKLFFKTHVEQDNVIGEYYNAAMLAEAGYPVIQPLYSSTRSGQQILIYEVVTHPSVFDVARQLETNQADAASFMALSQAQHRSDDQLYQCYLRTLTSQPAEAAQSAPVHQLFYHRLVGGRLQRFYGEGTELVLPHGTFGLHTVRQILWEINGCTYQKTLDDIIQQAIATLTPKAEYSVIGHGDAHNGNVFFDTSILDLIYFDPAFAGQHSPLLDLVKPLFHNVFAMWMYFPEAEREQLKIDLQVDSQVWRISHHYRLTHVRQMFLESKIERVLIPILQHLKGSNALPENWRSYLKSALFCCPFLTLDLKRFPPEIALLGLTTAVEMGAESGDEKRSIIDTIFDEVEAAIK